MPEFLKTSFSLPPLEPFEVLLTRLALALVFGGVIAAISHWTQRPGVPSSSPFLATLVLLCILIALVTQVIGNDIARAFSLVGTLAIVRFRTIVEDTRDTAFVIFAVVVGMALGTGNLVAAIAGVIVVGGAAFLLRYLPGFFQRVEDEWTLHIRVGAAAGDAAPWDPLFARHLFDVRLLSTATARQGVALDLTYKVRLRADTHPRAFLSELNRLEGIQSLELRRT